jgi:hypothetical protein
MGRTVLCMDSCGLPQAVLGILSLMLVSGVLPLQISLETLGRVWASCIVCSVYENVL